MSNRRFALPFLGAVGVALTTLAVGYYTYKYTRNYRTQLRPRSQTHSGHTTPSPTENHAPQDLPQPPIQNDGHLVQHPAMNFAPPQPLIRDDVQPPAVSVSPPLPTYQNNTLPQPAFMHNFSPQTQNFAFPQHGPPTVSLRDHEALSFEDPSPQPPTPLRMTNPNSFRGEELIAQLPTLLVSDRKSCQALMVQYPAKDPEIELTIIEEPMSIDGLNTLEVQYAECVSHLRNTSRDVQVVATIGEEHASSLLSLIRLRKMLERIAVDDTSRHCRSLQVNLPANMGDTSSDSNEALPGLHPLPTILPRLETLSWTSCWKQLHLTGTHPYSLNHLTNLTLESRISVPDAIYLLHCVCQSLSKCSIKHLNDVHDHTDDYTDIFPAISGNVTLKVESFSVHANSSASCRLFLNQLQFGDLEPELKELFLKVENGPVNPVELKTIPWAVIRNIELNCDLVAGGDVWVRGQVEQSCSLQIRS